MIRVFALLLALLSFTACHTLRFGIGNEPESKIVHERNSFFFWGLTPIHVNDASKHCPNGVVAIKEQTTFGDGLADFFTLGIWSLRSTWYYCAPEGGNP